MNTPKTFFRWRVVFIVVALLTMLLSFSQSDALLNNGIAELFQTVTPNTLAQTANKRMEKIF